MFDSADVYSGGRGRGNPGAGDWGASRPVIISTKATFRSGDGQNAWVLHGIILSVRLKER